MKDFGDFTPKKTQNVLVQKTKDSNDLMVWIDKEKGRLLAEIPGVVLAVPEFADKFFLIVDPRYDQEAIINCILALSEESEEP